MQFSKFTALFRRRELVQRVDEELEFHLRMQMEENIRRGLDPPNAQEAARRKLGNRTQVSEEVYRMNTIAFLDEAVQNVRFSLRTFRRNPGFALTAVLVLALGLGSSTAMFSALDRILFRPLPYGDANHTPISTTRMPSRGVARGFLLLGFAPSEKPAERHPPCRMASPSASRAGAAFFTAPGVALKAMTGPTISIGPRSGSATVETTPAGLPGAGARIAPAHAAGLAKLRSPNNLPAVQTAAGAHHWRLQLLEFQANVGGAGRVLVARRRIVGVSQGKAYRESRGFFLADPAPQR